MSTEKNAINIAVSLIFLSITTLFFIFIFYSAPQADDFCFGIRIIELGFWSAIADFYYNWSGRLFSSSLILFTTLIYRVTDADLFLIYHLFLSLVFISILALSFWLIRLWFPLSRRSLHFLAFSAFLLSLISSQRDLGYLYWLPSVYTYIIPSILICIVYSVLHMAIKALRPITKIETLLLAFAIVPASLSNEFSGIICSIMVILAFLVRKWKLIHPLQTNTHVILLFLSLVSFTVLYLSPGNEVRQGYFPQSGNFLGSALWAFPTMFRETGAMIVKGSAVIGWIVFVLILSAERSGEGETKNIAEKNLGWIPVLLPIVAAILVGYLGFAAGYYAQGKVLPGRAQNEVYFLGLVLLSFGAVELGRGRKWDLLHRAVSSMRSRRLLISVSFFLILANYGTFSAIDQLISGEASAFYRENRERYRILREQGEGNVVVAPPSAKPSLLYQSGLALHPRNDHWVNKCTARFFGKDSVEIGQ